MDLPAQETASVIGLIKPWSHMERDKTQAIIVQTDLEKLSTIPTLYSQRRSLSIVLMKCCLLQFSTAIDVTNQRSTR